MESVDDIILRLESTSQETRLMLNEIRFLCQYGDRPTYRASGTILRYPETGPSEMYKVFGDGDGILESVQALEKRFHEVVAKRWGE